MRQSFNSTWKRTTLYIISFSCEFYERFRIKFWNRKILTTAFLFCYLIPKLLYFILIVWLRQYLFGWTNWPCMILKLHSSQRVRKWKIKVKNNDMGIRSFFFTSLRAQWELINALWHASELLGQISLACTKNASFPAE